MPGGQVTFRVHAMPPPATDVAGPVQPWDLLVILALEHEKLLRQLKDVQDRRRREVDYLQNEIKRDRGLRQLTGDSPPMRALRQAIQQVARTDSTVLIQGETGTGKELVARAIHQLSDRRDHLLVTVNCAALNPGVLTSELFGHEAGAFTGALKRRLGRFEVAQRGTLLLDEIAELPAETQVLLLRVLQERTIERVGGNEPIKVDVRVVGATHQDLVELVRQGKFRADLFFRLNVFPLRVPPLRERTEDIPDLIRHFLHQFNRRMNKAVTGLEKNGLEKLLNYSWPGNVRELEHIVERAMILAQGPTLRIDPGWLTALWPVANDQAFTTLNWQERERLAIREALRKSGGRIYGLRGAAALLGLKPSTVYGKMRRLGLSRISGNESRANQE